MRLARLLIVGSTAIAPACGAGSTSIEAPCHPTATEVCMLRTAFSPPVRTVSAGTTVLWKDASGRFHTVTSSPGSPETFDIGIGPASGLGSLELNTPGTYHYYCKSHGTPSTGMRGTIQVN